MSDRPPWEPPLAGTEVEHLVGALDRQRATFRWKADGLDEAGLRHRIGASHLTLAGLLAHLSLVEDYTMMTKFAGEHPGEPWESLGLAREDDWEFRLAERLTPTELYDLYDGAVARAQSRTAAAIARAGLDQQAAISDGAGNHPSLRRLLFDLLEEYGRHTGHADLLRESVDGVTGEDPPGDWRP